MTPISSVRKCGLPPTRGTNLDQTVKVSVLKIPGFIPADNKGDIGLYIAITHYKLVKKRPSTTIHHNQTAIQYQRQVWAAQDTVRKTQWNTRGCKMVTLSFQ